MAHFQNKYGAAHSTDAYGNVIPTDEYGSTQQGGQQQQRHDLSTEYDGQGGRRHKGLKEKITENIPGVGNKDHRNDTSSANPIRHSGITHQGGQQQQQRHDLTTEYDGQGGRRNKGMKEKITENIPGVGNNDTTSTTHTTTHTTTAGGYGTGEQAQLNQHAQKKGMMEKIKEKLPGQRTSTYDQHNQHY